MTNKYQLIVDALRDFSWDDHGLDEVELTLQGDIHSQDWLYDLADSIWGELLTKGGVTRD